MHASFLLQAALAFPLSAWRSQNIKFSNVADNIMVLKTGLDWSVQLGTAHLIDSALSPELEFWKLASSRKNQPKTAKSAEPTPTGWLADFFFQKNNNNNKPNVKFLEH